MSQEPIEVAGKEWSTVEFRPRTPISLTAGYVMGGTTDLDAMNTVVTGVPIGPDTYVLGILQEKKLGLAGGLITLISCEPLPDGSNSFIARLTLAPLFGQSVLLGFAVFNA